MKHPFHRRPETMKIKKLKDFTCQHILQKKDKGIYIYELIGRDLCLCERCETKLRAKIFEQDKIEKEMKPFADKCKKYEKSQRNNRL